MNRNLRIVLLSVALIVGVIGGAASVGAVRIGEEGCSPGYWRNHLSAWEEYSPGDRLDSVFAIPAAFASLADDSLLDALGYGGGPTPEDKAKILLHHAVAAVLNAASEQLGYPYRRFGDPGNIIPTVNSLLAGGNADAMLAFKGILDAANNLGADGFCD